MDNSENKEKVCFIIMPISDPETYGQGHFKRVYEFIIKPACTKAGFVAIRADDVQQTNYIVIDILKRILEADMVLCDLSSRNPNVMYELGIRQAFNLPVTLIRDSKTERIFDIQGLRDIEYEEDLRVDKIELIVNTIAATLNNTHNSSSGDINSVIQLLSINPAKLPSSVEISRETTLILEAISAISRRLLVLEEKERYSTFEGQLALKRLQNKANDSASTLSPSLKPEFVVGGQVSSHRSGEGEIVSIDPDGIATVIFPNGKVRRIRQKENGYEIVQEYNL